MSDYTMYYGRGAGRAPTASTVIGDIGDIARNLAQGQTRYRRGVPTYGEGRVRLKPAGEVRSCFYVRFAVADRPGAFGSIATVLGRHGVSISAASQKAQGDDGYVPVVMLTHEAKTADLEAALEEIAQSGVVSGCPVKLRMI
jgi:homoserine dehydrogenase